MKDLGIDDKKPGYFEERNIRRKMSIYEFS